MADWVAQSVAPTRHKLRKATKVVNQTLAGLKVEKHPDKTFTGRIERGFDFLGYHFSPRGLSIAPPTIERFKARLARLYDQRADQARLGLYSRRYAMLRIPSIGHLYGHTLRPQDFSHIIKPRRLPSFHILPLVIACH